MQRMALALLAASDSNNSVNVLVLLSVIVPVVVVIILPFVFFRAARRNDEREALEKQALLEKPCLRTRAESLVELLEMKIMMARTPGLSNVAH